MMHRPVITGFFRATRRKIMGRRRRTKRRRGV
jgi:hypothetical protein